MKLKKDAIDIYSDSGPSDSCSDSPPDNPVVSDLASRRIDVFCKIDQKATLYIHQLLNEFRKGNKAVRKRGKVTIVVNSYGGWAFQGLAIYDLIRSSGFDVRTVILGEVASSGIIVALAGRERLMHQNAILRFHQPEIMEIEAPAVSGRNEEVIRIERAQIRLLNKSLAAVIQANSRLTLRQLQQLLKREAYMTAPEALKAGLVHKIIEHF